MPCIRAELADATFARPGAIDSRVRMPVATRGIKAGFYRRTQRALKPGRSGYHRESQR